MDSLTELLISLSQTVCCFDAFVAFLLCPVLGVCVFATERCICVHAYFASNA